MSEELIEQLKEENKTLKNQLKDFQDVSAKVDKLKEDNDRKERVIQSLQNEKKDFTTKLEEMGIYKELGTEVIDSLKEKAGKGLAESVKDLPVSKQLEILRSAISDKPEPTDDKKVDKPKPLDEKPKPHTTNTKQHYFAMLKQKEEKLGRKLNSAEKRELAHSIQGT